MRGRPSLRAKRSNLEGKRPSAPLRGRNAPRLDCFTLRVRNDNTRPVIASEAKQSSVRAFPVWIASAFALAMTIPRHCEEPIGS
ncbi:MAG: hypothetical protein LBT00_11785 [Spirochaetaceae bacterium]|nr:hypothetical protein [Spirochaetaceae bacterium]